MSHPSLLVVRRGPITEAVSERLRQQGVIAVEQDGDSLIVTRAVRDFALVEATEDTRILVIDLIIAARALGEFRVVAAGSMYATLELTTDQRRRLTEARVAWQLD